MILSAKNGVTFGFQSTLSMRRATRILRGYTAHMVFQSTLSMRRATRMFQPIVDSQPISIHALHEESDPAHVLGCPSLKKFQSTLSMRRATVQLDIFVRFLRRKPAA